MPLHRVVVTGAGVLCPLGSTVEELWQGLVAGRSGIAPLTRFDAGRFHSRHAGQVDDSVVTFAPGPLQFETKRMSAFVRYALFAADRALDDSGLGGPAQTGADVRRYPPGGGVYLGVAMGGLPSIEEGVLRQERRGVRRTSPFLIPSLIPNMAASVIALRHGIEEEQVTVAGACASGSQAIGQAMRAIRSGARTWAVAGGAEAVITPITYSGFQAMRVLSRHDDPQTTPRPFDRSRDGIVVGEGAAVLVLEERAHAEARGAVIHGELTGFDATSGGDDLTAISSRHVTRCLSGALADAGLEPDAVDCVFAQASGMVQGDAAELEALEALTADTDHKPVVTSIKGHMGYTFAANGPLNLAAALMSLRHQAVPPTLNLKETDPRFVKTDLAREVREMEIRRCLVNAFGFGGINAGLVVSLADPRSLA
ncbi:beta-ketoacyl-[acyl-carrier-protein] synthase family protein [Streptomyces alboniger]|uniref:Beta-ketoacyl-[acyl-carrier-protein] synthase family protein n=1 Tax=Streptomyces alboniger TaxID=132473 RepID=A0A5J6HPJ7_STRAD|nr:beta-ketoacyl-[acyl-carrier-protein] synthase family protein [Streptomyces alboniger]QEV20544.1 beta-ketoacyl-[acyl-carrier-protein] synthase family protein [Streptomyces alboniger]